LCAYRRIRRRVPGFCSAGSAEPRTRGPRAACCRVARLLAHRGARFDCSRSVIRPLNDRRLPGKVLAILSLRKHGGILMKRVLGAATVALAIAAAPAFAQ